MGSNEIVKVDTHGLENVMSVLKASANSIVVSDKETSLTAKTMQRDVRSYMKDVHSKLDPFVEAAKQNLAKAKDELNKWLAPAEAIDEQLAQKVKDYERREREAAEADTRRVNEERRKEAQRLADEQRKADEERARLERAERERVAEEERKRAEKAAKDALKAGEIGKRDADRMKKAAETEAARKKAEAEEVERVAREVAVKEAAASAANVQEVIVQPDLAKVAGVPSRRNWKFKIVDATKVPRLYCVPDEVTIGQMVRTIKDKAKVEALIPGIEAYLD